MDCILLEFTLNNTLTAINTLLESLMTIKSSLPRSDLGLLNEIIGKEIRGLNTFSDDCVDGFCDVMTTLLDHLSPPMPELARRVVKRLPRN